MLGSVEVLTAFLVGINGFSVCTCDHHEGHWASLRIQLQTENHAVYECNCVYDTADELGLLLYHDAVYGQPWFHTLKARKSSGIEASARKSSGIEASARKSSGIEAARARPITVARSAVGT